MYKLTLLFLLLPFTILSQDIIYAKQIVKTLCSNEYKGRGYVGNGDKIAAEFISKEFEQIGLEKFNKTYFQKYTTSVNSFPSDMELSINGKKLVAGKDFLISPGSPSLKGEFYVEKFEIKDVLDKTKLIHKLRNSRGKIIVLNSYNKDNFSKDEIKKVNEFINFLKYSKENPSKGTIILTTNKLTWSGSTELDYKASLTVNNSEIDFDKINTISLNAKNKFFNKYKTQNVISFVEGNNQDSLIVFVAHYDHLGMMGKDAIFPGANDNASGVAMLLSLAKHYKKNKPDYNTVFIAFGSEEIGLVGAKYFIKNPLFDIKKIKFLVNFDITGTGVDGIKVVNGSIHKSKFDLMTKINDEKKYMKDVKIRGEACNSDHCVFHMKGVPSFFIYTLGGIKAYHDIYDKAETLPLTEFEDYHRLIVDFVDAL